MLLAQCDVDSAEGRATSEDAPGYFGETVTLVDGITRKRHKKRHKQSQSPASTHVARSAEHVQPAKAPRPPAKGPQEKSLLPPLQLPHRQAQKENRRAGNLQLNLESLSSTASFGSQMLHGHPLERREKMLLQELAEGTSFAALRSNQLAFTERAPAQCALACRSGI